MRNRIAAAAAALTVAVVGACTPRPQTPLVATASVTVNSNEAKFQIVKCTQVEWYRTIDIGGNFAGATFAVDERREPVTVESVHIRNLGGFTGMYSQGGEGDATISLERRHIHDHRHGQRLQGRQTRMNRHCHVQDHRYSADRDAGGRPGRWGARCGWHVYRE